MKPQERRTIVPNRSKLGENDPSQSIDWRIEVPQIAVSN
jgi:hypothetical protein